jgi:hypothetical protein
MPESNTDIEIRVKQAVAFLRTMERLNIVKIARLFNALI